MGLDITAYRQLKQIPADEVNEDNVNWCWRPGISMDWSEATWPGRAAGVPDSNAFYSFTEEFSFRAGSYGGYNNWRNQLADLATSKEAFFELIHFADNEGVIGPRVAAKLAKDFADHKLVVLALYRKDSEFLEKYKLWLKACGIAADGGAISFH